MEATNTSYSVNTNKKRNILDIFITPNSSVPLKIDTTPSSVENDFAFVGECFSFAGNHIREAIDATMDT